MLQLRTTCENCDKALPNNSNEAMICSYECTFCEDCVNKILQNVCPNCGGGFEKRPSRPNTQLEKFPQKKEKVYKPVNLLAFKNLLETNKNIAPRER